MHDKILILDFGSQVTQLIARRVREAHVFCEIHPNDVSDAFVREFAPKAVILSGSHASTYEEHDLRAPDAVWQLGVPVLGICYGMFTMAVQQGGQVEASSHREFGYAEVRARGHTKLLDGLEDFATDAGHGMLKVWMSHGDKVTQLPPGFTLMASTPSCPIAGMADEARGLYGVQFHPEVTHTVKGREIIERFVLQIAGAKPDWVMRDYIEEAVARIREQVGSDEVILGLSGGVDSSVAAALIHKAIGDRLTCVFVDHGLLRLDEGLQVMQTFAEQMHVKVIGVDASEAFLGCLAGVTDPEAKRKIIGREFVEVFTKEAAKLKQAKWLAQGTIYPDVIESGGAKTKKATTIKSHHNVGGLPATLGLKLLEPLRELFKDEVRELGVALGLPHDMVHRHPFPGPGLGVRILGEVARLRRAAPSCRRDLHRGAARHHRCRQRQDLVPADEPGLRGVPAGEVGRGDGRWPHLRLRGRAPRRADQRLHDRRLGRTSVCAAEARLGPDHQRGARHQSRCLRRVVEAAGDDRVGVRPATGAHAMLLVASARPEP